MLGTFVINTEYYVIGILVKNLKRIKYLKCCTGYKLSITEGLNLTQVICEIFFLSEDCLQFLSACFSSYSKYYKTTRKIKRTFAVKYNFYKNISLFIIQSG